MTAATLVCALRGAAAIGVLVGLVGGLPRVVQVGLAVVAGVWPAVIAAPAVPLEAPWLLAGRELAIGAAIGVIAAVPLLAVGIAGQLVDRVHRRSSAAEVRGAYGGLFGVLAAAVFVGIDGHVAVVTAIATSFADAPVVVGVAPRAVDALAGLFPTAVRLAVPWLVTAAVVEIAVGVAVRIGDRAAAHAPMAAAVPAAVAMMTASLVGTLAVAIAAIVR
jgi:flagellar biosynthetic protein FliR